MRKLSALVVVFIGYCCFGAFQLYQAHPTRLIFASVYSDLNYRDTKIVALPFRKYFAQKRFSNMKLKDFEKHESFSKNIYWVLGVRARNTTIAEQQRLEHLADSFIDKGVLMSDRNEYGCSAIKMAILNKDIKGVEYLLSRGDKIKNNDAFSGAASSQCKLSSEELINVYLPTNK